MSWTSEGKKQGECKINVLGETSQSKGWESDEYHLLVTSSLSFIEVTEKESEVSYRGNGDKQALPEGEIQKACALSGVQPVVS